MVEDDSCPSGSLPSLLLPGLEHVRAVRAVLQAILVAHGALQCSPAVLGTLLGPAAPQARDKATSLTC